MSTPLRPCGRYPAPDGFIARGDYSAMWTWTSAPTQGLRSSPHVLSALSERWHGMPVMAPLFHCAVGFGFAAGMKLASGRKLPALLLANPIALLWDVPCRIVEAVAPAVPRATMVPLMLVTATALGCSGAASFGAGAEARSRVRSQERSRMDDDSEPGEVDYMLTLIAAINAVYFTSCFWRFPAYVQPELYVVASAVCALSVMGHAWAAGAFGGHTAKAKAH